MEHLFKPLLLMFFLCMTISYAADLLQNPDFENVTANGTSQSQFLLLNRTNSIPGWSFSGTVYYVTSGNNLLFNGGHTIQLRENGRINQTLRVTGDVLDYFLSFNLAVLNDDCANNRRTAVNVTVNEGSVFLERSRVFYFGRNFSRNLWETNAFYLGRLGSGDYVNLDIKSVTINSSGHNNVTACWPLVDAFRVKRNHLPRWYNGNLLANEDFEVGPTFLNNSSDGILLYEEQDRFNSPLQEWSILGTIKYIDSKHYKVPHGKAAIELLSGDPSGIQVDLNLPTTLTYMTLNFTMGDANDSCVGEFVLFLQVGQNVLNFVMSSYGTGSAFGHSITFKVAPSRMTSISFYSFNETRRGDGVVCGPVLDRIVLVGSYGESYGERMIKVYNGILIISLFIANWFIHIL